MASEITTILLHILALPTILWLTVYILTNLYMYIMGPVDVKKKYNAKWALVTGIINLYNLWIELLIKLLIKVLVLV